ncbi:GPW/gp25 family protein [Pseudozobellia thermophila]|uniref:Gene 25-like lysozyme n=1 Tax=Pseudozobellia thermophila TaxID=192903 RepID=A0A1M6P7J5_9FLAO|nr:GPW/gp25 family protein [Pseudozobellia thermophila]SHK03886.1 Gene 25-like lysozyme [Pseudozobellia thermophila]
MAKPYYQAPFDFKRFFEKKELKKIGMRDSISQFISIIITTYFEEYTFDEDFGSEIWETDFDLLVNANVIKERIKRSLKNQIETYEKRLSNIDLNVELMESLSSNTNKVRLKKYLYITIRGTIVKTDEPFVFTGDYYLAPLSYKQ